jgi:hypothetical protein
MCDPFFTPEALKKGIMRVRKYNIISDIYPKSIMGPLVKAIKVDK